MQASNDPVDDEASDSPVADDTAGIGLRIDNERRDDPASCGVRRHGDSPRRTGPPLVGMRSDDRRAAGFIATIAHELRNPLAPISSGLELIRSGRIEPDELTGLHDMMARQVGQMTRLVDGLMDLSRIACDSIELQRAPVLLDEIVDAAIEACRPLLDGKNHTLAIERATQRIVVDADAVRLVQVLSNLLNNAVNYTPDDGYIVVCTGVADRHIRLSVSDNGIGLDADRLEHIFGMFTRVGGPTPHEHGGLGIGLTLSRRLVELHGGQLQVTSEGIGHGSRFDVLLPTTLRCDPPFRPVPAEVPVDAPGLRLLIVDDNRDAAGTLARILSLQGHDVSVAHDGRGALRAIGNARPDVVFLDIGLPDITGFEVAAQLQGKPWREEFVLVALTGWGSASDRQRSHEAGFDHHLTKPVASRHVVELLAELAQQCPVS